MTSGRHHSEPHPAFRFGVVFPGADRLRDLSTRGLRAADLAGSLGFAECSGLEVALEFFEYREGGVNDRVHRFPGPPAPGKLLLRRGLDGSTALWDWVEAFRRGAGVSRDGVVCILDGAGEPVRAWAFRDAVPVRWAGPHLDALGERVAMERLELAHSGLESIPVEAKA
ncbi:MAG: phage tail protein [Planctomycetes bacterium]|nr:phage tail protein [Planctomycetota bacterium]